MDIEITPHGKVTLVEIRGRIVDGEPAEQLQQAMSELISEKKTDTIFDMAGVDWFDSTGIGLLVSHYVSVTKQGGRILLLKSSEKVKFLLRLVRLEDRFGWAQELDEALAWFEFEQKSSKVK